MMVCMCMRSGFGGCWLCDRCVGGGGCGCCGGVNERLMVTQVTVTTVSIHSQKQMVASPPENGVSLIFETRAYLVYIFYIILLCVFLWLIRFFCFLRIVLQCIMLFDLKDLDLIDHF